MHDAKPLSAPTVILAEDSRFSVRLATAQFEIESAMRLRYRVFSEELGSDTGTISNLDSDVHDETSQHLLLIDRRSGETVGTYRMKSIEQAGGVEGFYSNDEFVLDSLPHEILSHGVETGRACIAAGHRTTRAIFLLWKALARHLSNTGKRYFFGCCSIFTKEPVNGMRAYQYLAEKGSITDQNRNVSTTSSEHAFISPGSPHPNQVLRSSFSNIYRQQTDGSIRRIRKVMIYGTGRPTSKRRTSMFSSALGKPHTFHPGPRCSGLLRSDLGGPRSPATPTATPSDL